LLARITAAAAFLVAAQFLASDADAQEAPPSREDDVAALREQLRALKAEEDARAQKAEEQLRALKAEEDARAQKAEEQLRALRADVEARDAAKKEPPPPPPKPLGYEPVWPWIMPPEGVSGYGYGQGQWETHQDSQDQLSANGALLNKDRFSIRRARAALLGEWQYAAFALELDANTTNGPQVDLRKAEMSLQYRPDRSAPAMLMGTLGLFDAPFGYELDESPRIRFFMERTAASQALFPGEPDLGFRLAGALGFFRWTMAAMNGQPLNSPYVYQDPSASKDVFFRFGVDTHPLPDLQVAGGLSAINGEGFHAGSTAAGSSLQWHDVNQDGAVQASELVGVASQAATPSQLFRHWAVGADLRMNYRSWLGVTKIYGEVVVAQNFDRALYIADPVATGLDTRELGFYAAAVQEVTKWGAIGLRYDFYDPNSNAFDKRGGSLIPFSEAIKTISPMAALLLPDRARLVVQYDAIKNAYARNTLGVPTTLADNVFTLRFQVQL
jgi:hypothetical protein